MKAISQNEPGDLDLLKEMDIAIPKPGRGDVLVEIRAIGFNPVDAKMRMGLYPQNYPLTLGVDFSGVVAKRGDLAGDFEVGDPVFGLVTTQGSNGSYAQYTCVPHQMLAKAPKCLSFEEAAAVPACHITAFEALIGRGALKQNNSLFIAGGSGGVGSAALNLAKAYRAGPIFTLAGSHASAAYLTEHFAISEKQIVFYQGLSVKETAELLMQKNGGDPFSAVFDFVGKKAKELCFEVVGQNGHVASILPEEESFPISLWGRSDSPIWRKGLSLHMVFLFAASLSQDPKHWIYYKTILSHLAQMFEKEEIKPPLIENMGELSIQTIERAHLRLEEGHTRGKMVMTVSHSKEG